MIKNTQLKELCPNCEQQSLSFYREWTDDGGKERAWVECSSCGFSEERTFTNSRLEVEVR